MISIPEKPVILQKDEFMMQLLELATEADDEVEVNYKDMTVRFLA